MPMKDLDEVFDPTLRLPIGGKIYVIQPVDAETGLWVEAVMSVAAKAHDLDEAGGDITEAEMQSIKLGDAEEKNLYKKLLGDAYDEMIADGVNWSRIKFAGTTALVWISAGMEKAEEYWESGGVAKKARKKPQDRNRSAK